MTSLAVLLPTGSASAAASFDYALVDAAGAVQRSGSAPATLLPQPEGAGAQLVVVVPASALSWHRVELPKGSTPGSPRIRAVLEGLLEDRLLDEPEALHLALETGAGRDQPLGVAVCDKAWLRSALQLLEEAGRPASRIVPEAAPASVPALMAVGNADAPSLIEASPEGVVCLPLIAGVLPMLSAGAEAQCLAEPAVVELAERLLARRVQVQTRAERLALALQSPWDLAQFDLASSGRRRAARRMAGHWADFLLAPRWRPARWAMLALVLLNLAALNGYAWKERRALQAQRQAVDAVLTQTFPQVKLVVDAPVQMEKELAQLRQAAGGISARDLEAMLGALALASPQAVLTAVDYSGGELRVRSKALAPDDGMLATSLAGRGYAARSQADQWILTAEGAR